MATKFLHDSGFTKAWAKITALLAGKQNVEEGKGLSENDFTDALKTKLDGIAAGAQVNVLTTVKVNSVALTPDASKAVNIDLSAYAKKTDIGSALAFQGSCTYTELQSKPKTLGHVWNVTDEHTVEGLIVPAGTNYAYDGKTWDALGGSIDLSNYATNQMLTDGLNTKADNNHSQGMATITGLSDALAAKWSKADLVAMTDAEVEAIING